MNNILNKLVSPAPVCIGSGFVTLDVIFNGDPNNPKFLAGGSCCNVLTILSYLGWHAFPVARLGKDIECRRIVEDIENWGVHTDFVEKDPKMLTPRIIEKIYSGNNPRHSFSFKCKHNNWLPYTKSFLLDSLKQIENKIPPSKIFYFDRSTPSSLLLAKYQKENGALVVFEPPRLLDDKNFKKCLEVSDIVKHCYGVAGGKNSLGIDIPIEIQTIGEHGLKYRANILGQKKWNELPPFTVSNLVDASGSGDWLTAGLIHVLGQKGSKGKITESKLKLAFRIGQCLAALNCHYAGARGIMYNVSKTKLVNLVPKVLAGKESTAKILTLTQNPISAKTKLASRCQICVCK